MPQDESMKDFVASAYSNREKYFGRKWDEVIGFSNIELTGNLNGKDTPAGSCWSRHMARLTRKVAKTDLGLQFDVFQGEQIDPGTITFGDMIDARRGFIYQTGDVPRGNGRRGFFDASAGFVGFGKGFYFGGAVHHLNRPDESMILGQSRLPMRFTGHAGADIAIGSKGRYASTTSIMPNIIYQYQNGFQELSIGTYIKYGNFTVGAWYRNRDAFILCFGITTEKFKIGYSYDLTVSKLGNGISGGSHEVSMGLNLKCKKKAKNFRKISCPSF
jgi:type IX secretion system PorP/SprF family membrane protein